MVPTVSMLDWEVASFGHHYTTSAWALYTGVAAGLVALIALAMAVMPPAGKRHELPLEGLLPLTFLVALLAGSFVGAPILAWWKTPGGIFTSGELSASSIFRPLLTREIALATAAGLLVFGAFVALRRRRVSLGLARASVAVGMLAMLLGIVTAGHATALIVKNCLPRITLVGHRFLHVGREREVEAECSCSGSWSDPAAQRVTAETPGPLLLTFQSRTSLYSAWRELELTAGEETASEVFQIREGNEWVYELVETTRMASAAGGGQVHEFRQRITLAVLPARIEHAIRIFPLEVRIEGEVPERLDLVGFDGSLRRLQSGELLPFLEGGGPGEPLTGFVLPGRCQGELEGGGPRAPAECRVLVDMAAGLSSTLLRILSLGTANYIPARERYTLLSATWGPEGGAELAVGAPPVGPDEVEETEEEAAFRAANERRSKARARPDTRPLGP